MVTSAFSRRNILKSTELARQLTKSIAESFEKCDWSRFNRLEFLGIYL
jgi:hypothetical protein